MADSDSDAEGSISICHDDLPDSEDDISGCSEDSEYRIGHDDSDSDVQSQVSDHHEDPTLTIVLGAES